MCGSGERACPRGLARHSPEPAAEAAAAAAGDEALAVCSCPGDSRAMIAAMEKSVARSPLLAVDGGGLTASSCIVTTSRSTDNSIGDSGSCRGAFFVHGDMRRPRAAAALGLAAWSATCRRTSQLIRACCRGVCAGRNKKLLCCRVARTDRGRHRRFGSWRTTPLRKRDPPLEAEAGRHAANGGVGSSGSRR